MFAISQKNSRKAILLMKLQVLQKNYGVFEIKRKSNMSYKTIGLVSSAM